MAPSACGAWRPKLFKPWKRVTCVLDIMHVVGYLWSAANALFGEGSKAGKRWVQQKLTEILRGRVGYVIGGLRQILTKQRLRKSVRETLAKVITFFHNHRRWMQYDAYLAAGLPVGTGVVESACGSVVKHRMEGEGKRWSLAGAEAILALRSLKKSHDNDLRDYWRFRARQDASSPLRSQAEIQAHGTIEACRVTQLKTVTLNQFSPTDSVSWTLFQTRLDFLRFLSV